MKNSFFADICKNNANSDPILINISHLIVLGTFKNISFSLLYITFV